MLGKFCSERQWIQHDVLNKQPKIRRGGVGVQSLSCVQLFATPQTAARQASLSFTISQSLLKLMSIESMMPSNHLFLCNPLLLPPLIFLSIRVFFTSGGQSIGASASVSVLPMNIQGWFPLGLTSLISLLPKGYSQESSGESRFSEKSIFHPCILSSINTCSHLLIHSTSICWMPSTCWVLEILH